MDSTLKNCTDPTSRSISYNESNPQIKGVCADPGSQDRIVSRVSDVL